MTEFEIEILKRFKDIDDKLLKLDKDINNHVHTIGKEMGEMNTRYFGLEKDISWLKNLREEECREKIIKPDGKESKEDIQTHTKVGMFEKFFWIVSTALISSMIGFIVARLFAK